MKRYKNEICLCLGDTHAPYHKKGTIEFLKKIEESWNPDRVIHMGDLLDIYSVSSYPKDIHHKDTWTDELKKGRAFVQEVAEIFPDMELLESNHDSRAYKASRVAGVPREFLVKYLDVIGAPDGWKMHKTLSLTVDSDRSNWLFAHTLNGGAVTAAKTLGKSVVLGHSHTKFGATALNTGSKLLWSVDAGCLISDKGSPYRYNKTQLGRPIRGAVLIVSGVPVLLPFDYFK